ncbi:NAD(P)-binding protein [Micromonospora sp. B9E7]|uniref:potassium channel family protein n=1 Tax=Micromonospora sp. B9E7 TaxID=3153574 RepID=UPI00325DA0FC
MTGVALLPTVTALVVDSLVRARLASAAGGMIEPIDNHVVLVGLGNIGTRVLEELHSVGISVVVVDRAESARGIGVARELGLPVIVGDATRPETLRAASVHTCRALVALTDDDFTNLETALSGRSSHEADRARSAATRPPLRARSYRPAATRAGLAALLPRTVPSPDAEPLAEVAPLRLLAAAPRDGE